MTETGEELSLVQRLGRLFDRLRNIGIRRASSDDPIPRPGEGESDTPADQATAVCYRRVGGSVEFMLVRTTKGGRWVFPKGHIEKDEEPWTTAQREALEEAGVRGAVVPEPLLVFPHEKHKLDGRHVELTIVAYLLHVESETDTPEPGRDPTWFPPDQAKQKLGENRPPRYQQAYTRLIDEACKELEHRA